MKRSWCVLLAVHGPSSLQASVWVDDCLLMPTAHCQPPADIIDRVMIALVDFRAGDSITAVVHGAGAVSAWSGANANVALHWVATTLMTVWAAPDIGAVVDVPGRQTHFHTELETGIRARGKSFATKHQTAQEPSSRTARNAPAQN